jgi:hypothetical protein
MTMQLVRAAVWGVRDAAMDLILGPILSWPADRRCSREERPRQGIANHALR